MFPLFTTRCLHVRHEVKDPSGGSGNCGRECCPVILPKWRLPRHLGIFYMPQIYNMGPTALIPLRRKACWGFFSPLKIRRLRPGLNPRTWVLKDNTLPLDHRSRRKIYFCVAVAKLQYKAVWTVARGQWHYIAVSVTVFCGTDTQLQCSEGH